MNPRPRGPREQIPQTLEEGGGRFASEQLYEIQPGSPLTSWVRPVSLVSTGSRTHPWLYHATLSELAAH
jgi:hypothetical protein